MHKDRICQIARGTKGFRMRRINSSWGVREGSIDYILINKGKNQIFQLGFPRWRNMSTGA